ncbi:hypothetical protein [Saccharothrix deserti]|uniref:hypothetical protein n=1 Tax=Saccharothrix deserti TaxID=2593674 RepID=UPI00131DE14D|nr:hypothetical protein [Saccharothrix deserti]
MAVGPLGGCLGLDFGDGSTEVTRPDGGLRISTTSAERALWYFTIDKTAEARLVWVESGADPGVKA